MQTVAKQMVEQNEMGAALFLVSSDSNYITNQTLNIDDENYMN